MESFPVSDCVEAQIRMTLGGEQIENTLWFKNLAAPNEPNLVGLGNALLAWWAAHYALQLSSDLTLREIYLVDWNTVNGAVHTAPAPAPAPAGVLGEPSLPNNCALCISFRTGFRGRSFRGRNYVSGLSEARVTGNTVSSGVVDSLVAAYNGLNAAVEDSGFNHVVVTRFHLGTPRNPGIGTEVQSCIAVDNTVDSQRRRLPGRGR